jgi:hypothetical protein
MMVRMGFFAAGELVVVETDDDWFLGTAEVTPDAVVIRTGFVGRPTLLALEDVVRVVPAAEYLDLPDVGEQPQGARDVSEVPAAR